MGPAGERAGGMRSVAWPGVAWRSPGVHANARPRERARAIAHALWSKTDGSWRLRDRGEEGRGKRGWATGGCNAVVRCAGRVEWGRSVRERGRSGGRGVAQEAATDA
ncbi:hypothetical protein R5R35_003840 [Gryllus longicercus]|uniref:Uncharacterized protein n=1 Tax=Gryllus longicercus TaxID=2509291 RepID=A0AAN9VRB7_9ORTH